MATQPSAPRRNRDAEFDEHAMPLLPVISRLAIALTGDESDADDLVQETFLRAYRAWDTFTIGTDCRKWMGTICRNVFRNSLRSERSTVPLESPELESAAAADLHIDATKAGLGDLFDTPDVGPAIERAIASLEPAFRDAVVLSDIEGYSYEEIAQTLAVPVGTVRSRLYRGRRRLQELLMAHALDAGIGARSSARRGGPNE